jgi:hypothetical protein
MAHQVTKSVVFIGIGFGSHNYFYVWEKQAGCSSGAKQIPRQQQSCIDYESYWI